jgi:hypothetical protein
MISRCLSLNRNRLALVSIVGVFAILYLPAVEQGMYKDDYRVLSRIQTIESELGSGGIGTGIGMLASFPIPEFGYVRPVWGILTVIEWRLFGWHSWGYHLVSLLLFLVNGALVFRLIKSLYRKSVAVWSTLLFALGPITAWSVLWISQQSYLLAGSMSILATLIVLAELRDAHDSWRLPGLAGLLYLLGILTHEAVVPLIVVAFFLFIAVPGNTRQKRLMIAICFGIALGVALIYRNVAGGGFNLPANAGVVGSTPVRFAITYVDLLANALVPFYMFHSLVSLGTYVALMAAFLLICLYGYRAQRRLANSDGSLRVEAPRSLPISRAYIWLGPVWVASMLLVVVPQGGSVRTMYIALIGMSLSIAALLASSRSYLGVACLALILLVSALEISDFRDRFACASATLPTGPSSTACPRTSVMPVGWTCPPSFDLECTPFAAFRWSVVRDVILQFQTR